MPGKAITFLRFPRPGDVYVLSKAPGWNVSVGWDEVDTPKAGNLSAGGYGDLMAMSWC